MRSPQAFSRGNASLVDERDARTAAGQHEGGDTARRTRSDDHHVEAPIVHRRCLMRDGTVPSTAEERRCSGQQTDPNRFAQDLFAPLPRRYDLLEHLLSLGQNGAGDAR